VILRRSTTGFIFGTKENLHAETPVQTKTKDISPSSAELALDAPANAQAGAQAQAVVQLYGCRFGWTTAKATGGTR
jgi:hypothetical protein